MSGNEKFTRPRHEDGIVFTRTSDTIVPAYQWAEAGELLYQAAVFNFASN